MTMGVGETARDERHADPATGGHREGDAGRAGLQPRQLATCVADALREDAHAASGLEHLEELCEGRIIIDRVAGFVTTRRVTVLLARRHGHRPHGVQKRGHEGILPELGVRHEMDRSTPAHRRDEEPVHERVGVVAGEDHSSLGGDMLASDHLDAAEERVHHHADEPCENPIGPTNRAHNGTL